MPRGMLLTRKLHGLRGHVLHSRRDGTNRSGHVWAWESLRQKLRDLRFGLVGRCRYEVVRRFVGEARREHHYGTQMQSAFGQGMKDDRESSRRPCCLEVLAGRVLRVQLAQAIREHRRIPQDEVSLALVHLGKIGEQLRGRVMSPGEMSIDTAIQSLTAQMGTRVTLHFELLDGGGRRGRRMSLFLSRAIAAHSRPRRSPQCMRHDSAFAPQDYSAWACV
jgi:hypothetical protein